MAVGNTNPLPQWQEPAVDKEGRWKPNWYKWIAPLLGRVDDTKERVDTVEDNVEEVTTRVETAETGITGLSASIATEETARIDGDATLAGDIAAVADDVTTVETTVNNNTATISQALTSINGLEARWGVDININGHVVGLVRLDGGVTGSSFRVVADDFIVQHPTNTGIEKQAFTVGLVDGVTTMVLNGDMVATGGITADKLNVTTLSTVTANAGVITAGQLRSADGKMIIDLDNKFFWIQT
jgi:hypothetical protein